VTNLVISGNSYIIKKSIRPIFVSDFEENSRNMDLTREAINNKRPLLKFKKY
jgi:hypothetical protein